MGHPNGSPQPGCEDDTYQVLMLDLSASHRSPRTGLLSCCVMLSQFNFTFSAAMTSRATNFFLDALLPISSWKSYLKAIQGDF